MYRGETRNPVLVIVLSIVTCGIYQIVWLFMVSNEINNAAGEKKVDPVIFFLLGLLCFPLMYVGLYKIDEALFELNPRYGLPAEKRFILWLLLSLVGIGWLFMGYQVQENLNNMWARTAPQA
ncbi:MAG: DUF4234 domain-containing protein [Eubacteriales bacterium]|nr:DUF4234 domain-containing protein [Clostridiales bacterium]MDD4139868.1 DUF4234 domain-containing protein [Eubacteriales bacterium]MDD4744210.1 DUF4234 domain-containing protein [Eubacteriales bacterium]